MDKEHLIDLLGGCAQMLRKAHDNLLTKDKPDVPYYDEVPA